MAYYDTPMTKLEAVNVALRGIGQTEAVSLDDNWPDVQMASKLIDDLTRQLQIRGWHWNMERKTFTPDVNDEILLPNNTISIDTAAQDIGFDVIQRGTKLYNTETFDRPLVLDLILLISFDNMPLVAKDYVACLAAIQLQQNSLGADSIDKYLKERCQQSLVTLRQDDNRRADRNTLYNNWTTYGTIQRGFFRRGAY
jgi:hypothetical protein